MSTVDTAPKPQPRVNWSRAFLAGLVATVVMTIVMLATGMNLMKNLGSMMVGSNASPGLQYTVGGMVHLMIGLFYGFVFAWLFGRVWEWNRFVKGVVYGLAIAGIAFAAMPLMSSMMGGKGGAGNPCNPCGGGGKSAANPCGGGKASTYASGQAPANPCNPQQAKGAMNPCHPEQGKEAMNPCKPKDTASSTMNPCHPEQGKEAMNPCKPKDTASGTMNPCHPQQQAANPCHPKGGANPCNPCGGGSSPLSSVMSLINHLIYALALAFIYKAQ